MSPDVTPLTPLLERMARFRASPPPFWARGAKSAPRRTELESIDRAVLEHLQAQGFLTTLPLTGDVDLKSPIADSVSYTVPGQAGSVWIKSDHLGSVGKVAQTTESQTWVRWHFLLHETAHCQFAHEPVRFKPSPGRLDESAVAALNTWQFGPLARTGGPMAVVLNECFADTYAAMMLLEASHHAPQAQAAIEDVVAFRHASRQACERIYAQSSEMSDRQAFLGTHNTDGALTTMLARTQDWKGRSPAQIKQIALQYASDALLDWAHPDRAMPLGGSQGHRIWNEIAPQALPLMPALTLMVSMHLSGGDALAYVRQTQGAHPSAPALLELWSEVATHVDALPAAIKAPLVAGLARYTPGVDHAIADITQQCCATCPSSLPSIVSAQSQFETAQQIIQAALEQAAPSFTPAMATWRKLRTTQATPSASSYEMKS